MLRRAFLVLFALATVSASLSAVPAAGAAAGRPRFGTDGRWIVDDTGRKLVLRGLNVMGAEFTPTGSALPYAAADFVAMRAMGNTVVRIPIVWANVEPARGQYDAAALARIRDVVSMAGAADLLVVLDMHQWHWSPCYGGNGMPEWATDPCPHIDWSESNPVLEAIPETAFWRSQDLQVRFADAWAAVAAAVGAPPNLLGYDILNEPPLGLIPPVVFENAVLAPFYRLVASRLRAVDPGGLIFVEPAISSFAHRFTMVNLGIERVVYSTHLYGDSFNDAAGHAGDFLGPIQFKPALTLGEQEAHSIDAAFWPGEWGYLDETQTLGYQQLQYASDMLAAQDQAMVGSAYWTFWKQGFPFTPAIQRILTRPSVFAVSGTPLSFTANETSLDLRWVAGRGPTTISVPAGWTPTVRVVAGRVDATVRPGGWVDLRAVPGLPAEVVITPA